MGHRICDTILDFCDPDQVKVKAVLEELEIMIPAGDGGGDSGGGSEEESAEDSDYSADEGGDNKKKVKGKGGKKKGKGKGDKWDNPLKQFRLVILII